MVAKNHKKLRNFRNERNYNTMYRLKRNNKPQNIELSIEDLQYQDIIEGPLILQVDKANDLIFSKYFKGLVDYDGVQRTETKMLTKAIVRLQERRYMS